MPHYAYVIQCEDGSFYTGHTKDLDLQVKLHMNGKGARYTRIHRPKKIVYVEEFGSRAEAMKRERTIKMLNHRQKLELINSQIKSKYQSCKGYNCRLDKSQQRIILRAGRMELKVGNVFECPEGHKAKIVWVSEDKKAVAVRCPQDHFSKVVKVVKVVGHTKPALSYRNQPREERKIYAKNVVFLIKI